MADALTDTPKPEAPTPAFFTFMVGEQPGQYELSTNMGEVWKWHVLKLAASIRKELEAG